ncbi:MAG TPA: cytochrome c3 family protein [Gemmatimonadales bacterium]|nr:cytochrome c3 family protein [Gemmatimonadales bacterium]
MRWRHAALIASPLMAAVLMLALVSRSPAVPQPVAFNHRKHTQDLQLACEFCHAYVTTGAHAGLPDATVCAVCHRAVLGESPEAARLTELLTRGEPLRFNKLFRLAPHVNYTHRRHVGIAKLECRECHGAIAESARPPARPLVSVNMDYCLDCHRARQQSVDCVACHR